MPNQTIYPFGQNASLPSGYPIADDCKTNSAQIALSAKQGVVLDGKIEEFRGHGKNLFDPNDPDYVTGKMLNAGGGFSTLASCAVSGFIPFTQEMMYMCASTNGEQTGGGYGICVYDSDKNYVNGWQAQSKNYAEWEAGVAYARFSIIKYADGDIQIEVGKTMTDYEAPVYGIKGDKILPNSIQGTAIADGTITADKLAGSASKNGNIAFSTICGTSRLLTADSLSNDTLQMTSFPKYLKRSGELSMSAQITSFDTIELGVGGGSGGSNKSYVKVDATKVYLCAYHEGTQIFEQEAHGLTIGTFIKVVFSFRNEVAKIVISTLSGYASFTYDSRRIESYGYPYIKADNSSLTDITLRVSSADLCKPIWVFGDSYVSFYPERWPYYLLPDALDFDNYANIGLAGSGSTAMYDDFVSALQTNTPKFVVWTLGMNEADSGAVNTNWKNKFDAVAELCDANGITLIAATVPNVPDRDMTYKNAYVKASGYRYIDFAKAVDAESANATWYAGCLATDNVHPTILGAKILMSQVLEDFPEIIKYNP